MYVRIAYIDSSYHHFYWTVLFAGILACVYVGLTPYIKKIIFNFLVEVNRKNSDDDYDYRIERFNKRNKLAEAEYEESVIKSGSKTLDELRHEIHSLKKQLSDLQDHNSKAEQRLREKIDEAILYRKLNDQLQDFFKEVDYIVQGHQSIYSSELPKFLRFADYVPANEKYKFDDLSEEVQKYASHFVSRYRDVKDKLDEGLRKQYPPPTP